MPVRAGERVSRMRMVCVEWEDAYCAPHNACPLSSDDVASDYSPHLCYDVGWVAHQDAKVVALARSAFAGHFRGIIYIPRGMIRRMRTLREAQR